MRLIFMGIFRNFLHPKPGANTMDFCRQYQVKLDPKITRNLHETYTKLTKLAQNLQKYAKVCKTYKN